MRRDLDRKIEEFRLRMERKQARAAAREKVAGLRALEKKPPEPAKPDPSKATWDVYTLGDPRTGRIRYVGISVNLKDRIRDHVLLGGAATPNAEWLRQLSLLGLLPEISIVQSGRGPGAAAAECRWIGHFRELFPELLNVSNGGYNLGTNQGKALGKDQGKPHTPRKKRVVVPEPEPEESPVTMFDLVRDFRELCERASRGRINLEARKMEIARAAVRKSEIAKLNQALRNWPRGAVGILFSPSPESLCGGSYAG